MYLGLAMEQGAKEHIFARPLHPYTRALLASTPGLAGTPRLQRVVLSGELPSPLDPPQGCVFSTRCPHATARCRDERPAPRPLDGSSSPATSLKTFSNPVILLAAIPSCGRRSRPSRSPPMTKSKPTPRWPRGARAALIAALAVPALRVAAAGQDAGVLLGGQPRGLRPMLFTAGTTFDASSKADLQPADRVRARRHQDRRRAWPRASPSPTTGWSTPSSCVPA